MLSAIIVASLVTWAYAATFLTVSNTATISLGASLTGATTGVGSGTNCSTQTSYSASPVITWPIILTGRTTSAFLCLQNIGTDNYPVSIVVSGIPLGDGTVSTPQSGTILAPSGFLLVALDWTVPAGAPLGPVSFNVTFQ